MPQTKIDYFPLGGGLDLTTPALSVKPGRAIALSNYEPWYNGGYRRVDGFERFDGQPKPSEQTFIGFDVTTVSGLTLGDTITDDVTGATGTLIGIWDDDGTYGSDAIGVAQITGGSFGNGNDCNTSAFTISSEPIELYAPSTDLEDTWILEAQDLYRDDISVVPGSGIVRGAWQRLANVYAIRDDAGATEGVLHKSSSSGWTTSGITMADYIYFNTGLAAGASVEEGDTLTGGTSGATATIHRIILQGGSWAGSDAYGYFVLTSVSGGPFGAAESLESPALTAIATSDGANVTFAFSTGGHYRFVNHNFFGGSGTFRTYGVNGIDPAFEIDENNVVSPILFPKTALTDQPDANDPFLIEEHRNYLFLGMPGGRMVHSVIGEPLSFNGFLGAAEFGMGDELTGLNSLTGAVLAITTARETRGLFGKDTSDWELKLIGEKTGGKLFTPRKLDTVYAFDDLGITSLARTDSFGDFIGATVSQLIQPLINQLRDNVTDATIVRKSNQYRVFFDDNSGLVMYVPNAGMAADQRTSTRTTVHFSSLVYPFAVRKIYNTEDDEGTERTYFTSDDGYVYEDQIGNNFDGVAIQSSARLVFNQIGTPSFKKRFRRAILELDTTRPLTLSVVSELTYGSPDVGAGNSDISIDGGGGLWDVDDWDTFFFDGQTVATATVGLTGSGENIGLLIFNESAVADPYVLQGITYHYENRRLQR